MRGTLRPSKAGPIEYLTLDLIYLRRIEHDEKSHFVYINYISHFLNVSTQTIDKRSESVRYAFHKMLIKGPSAVICKRYTSAKESACIKLPEEGSCMKFNS